MMSENTEKAKLEDSGDTANDSCETMSTDGQDLGKSSTAKAERGEKWTFAEQCVPGLRTTILMLICCIAVASRQFAVVRYESIIHEYDPWFNYRSTEYMLENGYYKFKNWFDFSAWYPIGRVTGKTLYPGLMMTTLIMHSVAKNIFLLPIHIREVCVFTAPIFACLTTLATYGFTIEISGRSGAGLIAALLISIVPAYMSRSVSGSYDNESVAIFALVFAFYSYARSLRIGSMASGLLATVAYFYMVITWGGYVFVLGFFSMYSVVLVLLNRLDIKAYLTFSMVYVIGNMFSLTLPLLQDHNVVWKSSEHLISHFAFIIVQLYFSKLFLKKRMSRGSFRVLTVLVLYSIALIGIGWVVYLLVMGKAIVGHRIVALLNPTYSKKRSALTTSISEHNSLPWGQIYAQLHYPLFLAPVGVFFLVTKLKKSNAAFLGILYWLVSIYFASVMSRLVLIAGPASCVIGGVGTSYFLGRLIESLKSWISSLFSSSSKKPESAKKHRSKYLPPVEISLLLLAMLAWLICRTVFHGAYESALGYAEPVVVMSWVFQGKRYYLDDFRQSYSWIRQNTPTDAVIMSWWDSGYQLAGLGNRTTVVDNNTWNDTHIGKVSYVSLFN